MTRSKRLMDLAIALPLAVLLLPLMLGIALVILWRDGRPVLHVSERMKDPRTSFGLLKFRTMRPGITDAGVTGGDKADRITATGHVLRRSRLDELPQLWNVLCGDISLVGPRPPLRQYVARFPELYAQVLRSRPGVTGLATLVHHRHEERLLARCRTVDQTDRTYARICVPRKARLDLLYQARRSLGLDILLLVKTVFRHLPLGRPNRRRPKDRKP